MNKRIIFIAVLILTAISMTGCFGGTEVNDRAFVQLMGLDERDGIYMVSLQVYRSESGSPEPDTSKANSTAVSGRGYTISEALADAETKTGKRLFLGHIKMLIIGRGINSPSDELSLFTDGSISPSCPVVYSDDPAEAAETLPEEGAFSAEQFLNIMSASAAQGKTVYTSAADVVSHTGKQGCGAAIPVISANRKEKRIEFDGLVLADQRGISGSIPEDDVIGVKLLKDEFEKDDRITVPVSVNGRQAAVFITDADTKLRTDFRNGKLVVSADISIKTKTAENPYGIINETLEKAVAESIRNSCERAFSETVRSSSCDIFGIKKLVRKYCPEYYKEYCSSPGKYLSDSIFAIKIRSEKA